MTIHCPRAGMIRREKGPEVGTAVLRPSTTALALAALFLVPDGAHAQRRPNLSWDTLVATVQVGRKLDVAAAHSTSYRGSLLAIDQRSITVRQEGASVVIPAADVLRVRYAGVRARHVRYGMAIGAVVGAVAMWAIDSQSGHPEPGSALGLGALFLGLPGGALAGAVIPIGPPLYQAPATAAAP